MDDFTITSDEEVTNKEMSSLLNNINSKFEDSEKDINRISKLDLNKMKKKNLESLAKQYNLSTLINLDGKMKKKTRNQLISDLQEL